MPEQLEKSARAEAQPKIVMSQLHRFSTFFTVYSQVFERENRLRISRFKNGENGKNGRHIGASGQPL